MRKIIALLLILSQLIAAARSETSLADFVAGQGFVVHTSETPTDALACCFTEVESGADLLAWAEAGRVYNVTGESGSEALKGVYVALLDMADWQSCAYFIGERVHMAFNMPDVPSERTFISLNTYAGAVSRRVALVTEVSEARKADPEMHDYVLNINSLKFHRPDCAGAGKIKAENRQAFRGYRYELILLGYAPCKSCKP